MKLGVEAQPLTVNVRDGVAVLVPFVTCAVTDCVVPVGVPVMQPVLLLIDNPVGSDPLEIAQV